MINNQRIANGVRNQVLLRCPSHTAVSRTGLRRMMCSQTLAPTKPSCHNPGNTKYCHRSITNSAGC